MILIGRLTLIIFALFIVSASVAGQAAIRELTLGVPLEAELKGGEPQSFNMRLTAGEYIQVIIEQKGIDISAKLFDPSGKEMSAVDSLDDTQGDERLDAITDLAGEYRVEIRAAEQEPQSGRFQVKLAILRDAGATDPMRVRTQKSIAEAGALRRKQTPDSLRQSIAKLEEALRTLRELDDRHEEGVVLLRIGGLLWQIGNFSRSLVFYEQGLNVWRELGERLDEGNTLIEIGTAQGNLGNTNEALSYYNQALVIMRALGNRRQEGDALMGVGVSYLAWGEMQKALECFNDCLALSRQLGNRGGEIGALHSIGRAYWYLGEPQKALEYYTPVLEFRRATGDRRAEGVMLRLIGDCYSSMGDQRQALQYYEQALPLHLSVGDQIGEGVTLCFIGRSYLLLSDKQNALKYLTRAQVLLHSLGDVIGEARTLSLMGEVYTAAGTFDVALGYLQEALSMHIAVGDQGGQIQTYQRIAHAFRDRGDLELAKENAQRSLDLVESMRSKLLNSELRASLSASLKEYYDFYIDLLMKIDAAKPREGYDAAAFQASERARARGLIETLSEAHADIREGVDQDLLARETAVQAKIAAKAESLTRLLNQKHAEVDTTKSRKELDDLIVESQAIDAEIRAKSPRYAALTRPQPLDLKQVQHQILDNDTILLEYALGEERSFLWVVTNKSLFTFILPRKSEIEAAARRVYETLTARNRTIRFEKIEKRKRRVAEADGDFYASSMVLSKMLLGPATSLIEGKRLLIVTEGALQYIPMGALPSPASSSLKNQGNVRAYSPLITDHEILSLPSASALSVLRSEARERLTPSKSIAVFADPVFNQNDPRVAAGTVKALPNTGVRLHAVQDNQVLMTEIERSARDTGDRELRRLPYSRREADAIAALAPSPGFKEALDFDANRSTALSEDLGNYRIVHFASHALLNSQHPELSGIVLSLVDNVGRPRDGFLRLHNIYNLKLNADLIVLSACRTALGKEVKGEGLVGLTRGFMYAGAPRVVASLWGVDDESTAELMRRFYEAMLKKEQRPAAALRSAQISMLRERHLPPYFWAAFTLQGEWK